VQPINRIHWKTGKAMENKLGKYLFMGPLLQLLQKGEFFARMVGVMLQVLAALVVLGSLATIFKAGKVMFDLHPSGIMGGIMYQLFYILAVYAVAHTLLIRAQDITNLKDEEFYALPIAAYLTRLIGEIYAAFVALTAIGGGIFVWFTGQPVGKIMSPVPFMFPVPKNPDFMGGIELIISGILLATASIIVTYLLAELLTALSRVTSVRKNVSTGPRQIADHRSGQSRFG
jgi:hypothetical protein